jgi:hypothetical protein
VSAASKRLSSLDLRVVTALSSNGGLVNAQPLNRSNTDDRMQWATLALDYGVQALTEAERDGATAAEIIRLCDEVIARRLRVQMMQVRAGTPAPPHLIAQMARDRQLLDQPSILDD